MRPTSEYTFDDVITEGHASSSLMNITVRQADAEDVNAIVRIHGGAFSGFFLTTLGADFLHELYRGFLDSSDGRVLVAEVDGKVAGFAAGTLSPERFFRRLLLARWHAFARAGLAAALRRPRAVIPRLLAAVRHRGERPSGVDAAALLSSIAVDGQHAAAGVGAKLINAYVEMVREEGLRCVYLTTDRHANERANRFYLAHGFTVESEIRRPNGRVMVRYVRVLDEM